MKRTQKQYFVLRFIEKKMTIKSLSKLKSAKKNAFDDFNICELMQFRSPLIFSRYI